MEVVDLDIETVMVGNWNANAMDAQMRSRLSRSIQRFGLVVPVVVRRLGDDTYETIGGAQRLEVLREIGAAIVPSVVVEADDIDARLLSQALNHIAGEDDLGLRAEVIRYLLDAVPQDELQGILPDSADELRALASMGETDLAEHLEAWQRAQAARLRHLQLQLTESQLEVVVEALEHAMARCSANDGNPNRRGNAMVAICRAYLAYVESTP